MAKAVKNFDLEALVNSIKGLKEPVVLKEAQREALCSLMNFRDTCVFLPTGYGKSMIFMLYPLMLDAAYRGKNIHVALVISPVRVLMRNLEEQYKSKGFSIIHVQERHLMSSEQIKGRSRPRNFKHKNK